MFSEPFYSQTDHFICLQSHFIRKRSHFICKQSLFIRKRTILFVYRPILFLNEVFLFVNEAFWFVCELCRLIWQSRCECFRVRSLFCFPIYIYWEWFSGERESRKWRTHRKWSAGWAQLEVCCVNRLIFSAPCFSGSDLGKTFI